MTTEPCEYCEKKRKEFQEAFKRSDFIKAARIAMEGVGHMMKGKADE